MSKIVPLELPGEGVEYTVGWRFGRLDIVMRTQYRVFRQKRLE